MSIFKNFFQKITCKSKCTFNTSDFHDDLRRVDLTKYQLKVSDLLRIQKIIDKRPSIVNYYHEDSKYNHTTDV